MEFKIDYFRIPPGGNIYFDNYLGFQKYKFLDFLRGVTDEFNLSFQTDSINKVVLIEPTHDYALNDDFAQKEPGYFSDNYLKWDEKRDLEKVSTVELFNDYDRELTFKYKEDTSDGLYKLIKDRYITELACGKYVFPERFKSGSKPFENRFFGVTMHYEAQQFKNITNVSPQMVCLVPENISNTSSGEAGKTFLPKSCYYKGLVSGVGGWKYNGVNKTQYPFMFAVNYKDGGHNDPVLSYSDENINGVIGKGLLKRFFWQRLAIMRNGQYMNECFKLNNIDIVISLS